MKKSFLMIFSAVITALLSTLCCFPAFLFLFFGISSGILTSLTNLTYLRVPFGILTIIFFILGVRKLFYKNACFCTKREKIKNILLLLLSFFIISTLLFYPEIIPYLMEIL